MSSGGTIDKPFLCQFCSESDPAKFYPSKGRRTCKPCVLARAKAKAPKVNLLSEVSDLRLRLETLNTKDDVDLGVTRSWRADVDAKLDQCVTGTTLDYKSSLIRQDVDLLGAEHSALVDTFVDQIRSLRLEVETLRSELAAANLKSELTRRDLDAVIAWANRFR